MKPADQNQGTRKQSTDNRIQNRKTSIVNSTSSSKSPERSLPSAEKEQEAATQLAKKTILSKMGLKLERDVENQYVHDGQSRLEKQDNLRYFKFESLKQLINREEWYNLADCVRVSIETLITACLAQNDQLQRHEQNFLERCKFLENMINIEKGIVKTEKADTINRISNVQKSVSETLKKMMHDQSELQDRTSKMFEDLTASVNRADLVAENMKARMHENTVDFNEQIKEARIRIELSRRSADDLRKQIETLSQQLQVPKIIGSQNCEYLTMGDFIKSAHLFQESAPKMIKSLANDLVQTSAQQMSEKVSKKFKEIDEANKSLIETMGNNKDQFAEKLRLNNKKIDDLDDKLDEFKTWTQTMFQSQELDSEEDDASSSEAESSEAEIKKENSPKPVLEKKVTLKQQQISTEPETKLPAIPVEPEKLPVQPVVEEKKPPTLIAPAELQRKLSKKKSVIARMPTISLSSISAELTLNNERIMNQVRTVYDEQIAKMKEFTQELAGSQELQQQLNATFEKRINALETNTKNGYVKSTFVQQKSSIVSEEQSTVRSDKKKFVKMATVISDKRNSVPHEFVHQATLKHEKQPTEITEKENAKKSTASLKETKETEKEQKVFVPVVTEVASGQDHTSSKPSLPRKSNSVESKPFTIPKNSVDQGPPSQRTSLKERSPFNKIKPNSNSRGRRERSMDSHCSGVLVKCKECNTRLYPCERTLAACRQDLKDYCRTLITEKLDHMYDMIDEKIKLEEVVNVNGPDVLLTRYKDGSTELNKKWNQSLFGYKLKHFARIRREKERASKSPQHLSKQETEADLTKSILVGHSTTRNTCEGKKRSQLIVVPIDLGASQPAHQRASSYSCESGSEDGKDQFIHTSATEGNLNPEIFSLFQNSTPKVVVQTHHGMSSVFNSGGNITTSQDLVNGKERLPLIQMKNQPHVSSDFTNQQTHIPDKHWLQSFSPDNMRLFQSLGPHQQDFNFAGLDQHRTPKRPRPILNTLTSKIELGALDRVGRNRSTKKHALPIEVNFQTLLPHQKFNVNARSTQRSLIQR